MWLQDDLARAPLQVWVELAMKRARPPEPSRLATHSQALAPMTSLWGSCSDCEDLSVRAQPHTSERLDRPSAIDLRGGRSCGAGSLATTGSRDRTTRTARSRYRKPLPFPSEMRATLSSAGRRDSTRYALASL